MVVAPGCSRSAGSGILPGHAQAGWHSLDAVHGVAAPGDVQAVGLAAAEGEAGDSGDQDGGRVVAGMTAAAFAQPQPVADLVALRDALGGLPPGEVEDLPDPPRQGEDHFQAVDEVGLAAQVGQRVPGADRAARHRLDLGHQRQAGGLVRGFDPGPAAVVLGPHRPEERRPVAPGGRVAGCGVQPVPGQARPAEPALPVLGQQGARPGRGQQRRGVVRVEPGWHRADPRGRKGVRPREQDQPGAAGSRISHQQQRASQPRLVRPACRRDRDGCHRRRSLTLPSRLDCQLVLSM